MARAVTSDDVNAATLQRRRKKGNAGLVFDSALRTGVYGGLSAIGAMAGDLSLTTGQAKVLAALILIAHGLPVEARMTRPVARENLYHRYRES